MHRGHLGYPKAGPQEPKVFASTKTALQGQATPTRKSAESKASISSSRNQPEGQGSGVLRLGSNVYSVGDGS